MNVVSLGHGDDPYAFYTKGHNPLKDHLKAVNEGWSDDWASEANTFYHYVVEGKRIVKCNVSPKTKGAVKATVSYWDEIPPRQIKPKVKK